MRKLYNVCCCCLNAAIKKDDSPLQIKRKKVFIFIAFAAIVSLLFVLPHAFSGGMYWLILAGMMSMTANICSLVYLCVLKCQATDKYIYLACIFSCSVIIMADFASSLTLATPTWPLFVLVIDLLLLAETPPQSSVAIVIFCCTWLIIRASERVFRFGLYDFSWGVPDQVTRRDSLCGCKKMPCSVPFSQGVGDLGSEIAVFVIDFLCTRGFAFSVMEEKRRILASIDTANHIATSLSMFDLEMASELLDEAVIPDELKLSFELILANLKSYRPYLPQSCFPEAEPEVEQSQRSASCRMSSTVSSMELQGSLKLVYKFRKPFSEMSVSLLVANVRNSLVVLQHSQKSFMDLISDLVSTSFTIICQNRGTLDLFLGDRIFANFGATRVHSGNALSCVEAAKGIAKSSEGILIPYQVEGGTLLSIDIGMGSGSLHCGDLGSDTMIRYSFIGKLAHLVSVVERAACKMNITMLCEGGLYRQVRESIEICVHLQTILHLDTIHLLYEVIAGIHEEEAFPEEWMYQLESRGVGKWDAFNKVASALLMGEKVSDIGSLADETDFRIEQLQIIMRDGVSTPLVVTSR